MTETTINLYHPEILRYENLQALSKNPKKINAVEKAKFELILTDALLTLINDLGFGTMNPVFNLVKPIYQPMLLLSSVRTNSGSSTTVASFCVWLPSKILEMSPVFL